MRVKTYDVMSNIMLGLGGASILGSMALYAIGMVGRDQKMRDDGVFVGLWAPTFFILADRLAVAAVEKENRLKSGEVDEDSLELLRAPQSPRPMQHVNR